MVLYVSTPQDLDNIRNNLSESYELSNDIDMSSFGDFTPIGDSTTNFTGQLNGNGFRIKNLTINTSDLYAGLFGFTEGATILDVGLTDINLNTTSHYAGALVGRTNRSIIKGCYATGNITGLSGTSQYLGGLIGAIYSGTIRDLYSHVNITDVRQGCGGFAGRAGTFVGDELDFRNCYSTGSITNATGSNGGFLGFGSSDITVNCYWDTESSGMPTSEGGATGKTTAQMKTASTYVGWSSTIWSLQDGQYPTLQAFGEEIVPIIEDRNIVSYSNSIESNLMLDKIATIKRVATIKEFSADIQKTIKSVKVGTTFVKDIVSGVSRSVQIIKVGEKEVTSYILPITSDVETLRRQVKIMTETVTSHVNDVVSDVYKEMKSLRHALSFIDLIVGRSITPNLRPNEINAIVNHIENGTLSEYLNSKYNLSIYENLSDENDMQNMSNVNVLLNKTIVEVRD